MRAPTRGRKKVRRMTMMMTRTEAGARAGARVDPTRMKATKTLARMQSDKPPTTAA
jgi:hypothetical protein